MTASITIARYLFCAEERSPLRRRSWPPEKRFSIGAFASRPVVFCEPANSGDYVRLAACSARGVSDWQLLFIPVSPFRFPPFLVHRFGAFPSPSGTRSSASLRALRVPVPPKTNSLKRQRTPSEFLPVPSEKADLRRLGAGPTPVALPCVTRANSGIKNGEQKCI